MLLWLRQNCKGVVSGVAILHVTMSTCKSHVNMQHLFLMVGWLEGVGEEEASRIVDTVNLLHPTRLA